MRKYRYCCSVDYIFEVEVSEPDNISEKEQDAIFFEAALKHIRKNISKINIRVDECVGIDE